MRKVVRKNFVKVTMEFGEQMPTVFGEQIACGGITRENLGPACMASADEYREYAEQCIALVTTAFHPGDKARLLQMAQAWRDLADKLDAFQNKPPKDDGLTPRESRDSKAVKRR